MAVQRYSKKNQKKPMAKRGRKMQIQRFRRPLQPLHQFTREVQYSLTNGAATNPFFFVMLYSLNELPNYTEFTDLFDQYRIQFVKVSFRLEQDPSAQSAAASVYPTLTTFNDFNDVTTPTSVNEFRERISKKITTLHPGKEVVRTIRPAITDELLKVPGGAAVTAPKWKMWLPTASPDIQYIGMKWLIENWTNTNYTITCRAKYYCQFKHVQ